MEPQNPQFNGQPQGDEGLSRLQRAADEYDAHMKEEDKAWYGILSGTHTKDDYSAAKVKVRSSSDNLKDLAINSPTDHVVKVLNNMGPDHTASWISGGITSRPDFTPEQQHQLVMSPNPSVSHHVSREAPPEIRAIHKLLHLDCRHCK